MIDPTVFIHEKAIVEEGVQIGAHTRIGAFTHILPGAIIGSECNICDQVFIENDVRIGNRVTVKSGVQLWDGVRIEDEVFIGPNVTFAVDAAINNQKTSETFSKTIVFKGVNIGANVTLPIGVKIGTGAMLANGSIVIGNVPVKAIVEGNPARIIGYVDAKEKWASAPSVNDQLGKSKIKGVTLHRLQHAKDLRGDLSAIEWEHELPFKPKRAFFVYNVPSSHVRGEHAHKSCHQFLLCIKGSISVVVDDGKEREEFFLNEPRVGIHIPPWVWGVQYKYSSDAVLVVLASHNYDPDDYIRDYDEFLAEINHRLL